MSRYGDGWTQGGYDGIWRNKDKKIEKIHEEKRVTLRKEN